MKMLTMKERQFYFDEAQKAEAFRKALKEIANLDFVHAAENVTAYWMLLDVVSIAKNALENQDP